MIQNGMWGREHNSCGGRSSTASSPNTHAKFLEHVARDLKIDESAAYCRFRRIHFYDLRRRKSARTVRVLQFHGSTMQYWATTCGGFIQKCQVNPHFLTWIFTEDECSVFLHIPVTKHQSVEWRTESSPKSKTFRCHKSRLKIKEYHFPW
jgi:hypothetical protein